MQHGLDTPGKGLGPEPAQVREVLVLCPGGLGKVVNAVPALRHLRTIYSDARITVVAAESMRDLLHGCPYVDRCLDAARPSEALLERFDVAIALQAPLGEEGSKPLGASPLLGGVDARVRAAYRAAGTDATHAVHPVWPERLADSHRMLRLVWLLGGERPADDLGLWPSLADRNGASQLVRHVAGRPIAVVHPGSGLRDRRWPIDQYARVLDLLASLGIHPVVVGVETDRERTHQLAAATSAEWTNLVGATSVGTLAGLLERAALFIGNDSGPRVLAAALGVHCSVIGPATVLEQRGTADKVTFLIAPQCAACDEPSCEHPLPPADAVPADVVLGHVALAARQAAVRWTNQRVG